MLLNGDFNMKKFFVLFLIVITCSCTVLASEYSKFSRKFIKHIRDCDAYEEAVTSEYEDITFKTTRKIHGWKNGLCKYTETITSPTGACKLDCGFTEIQIDDLYEAMKDRSKKAEKYALDLYAEKTDPKTGAVEYVKNGVTEIKGNRSYIIWAKYQNNPYICKPSDMAIKASEIGKHDNK